MGRVNIEKHPDLGVLLQVDGIVHRDPDLDFGPTRICQGHDLFSGDHGLSDPVIHITENRNPVPFCMDLYPGEFISGKPDLCLLTFHPGPQEIGISGAFDCNE